MEVSSKQQVSQKDAIKLAEKVARMTGDKVFALRAASLKQKLHQKPLKPIIAKINAPTWKARAKLIGVSRQAMWRWFKEPGAPGSARPNIDQATRIAKLTGVPVEVIRGE
jgi:DNA-binding XRE family transcriptional regulator